MFMRTLLYKGGRLVSHFLPVDDIDSFRWAMHLLTSEVEDAAIGLRRPLVVVDARICALAIIGQTEVVPGAPCVDASAASSDGNLSVSDIKEDGLYLVLAVGEGCRELAHVRADVAAFHISEGRRLFIGKDYRVFSTVVFVGIVRQGCLGRQTVDAVGNVAHDFVQGLRERESRAPRLSAFVVVAASTQVVIVGLNGPGVSIAIVAPEVRVENEECSVDRVVHSCLTKMVVEIALENNLPECTVIAGIEILA